MVGLLQYNYPGEVQNCTTDYVGILLPYLFKERRIRHFCFVFLRWFHDGGASNILSSGQGRIQDM